MKIAENRTRNYWFDAFKFISMLLVLIHHFLIAFYCNQDIAVHIGRFKLPEHIILGKLGLNIFIFISCLLFCEKSNKARIQADEFVILTVKRYLRLVIPAVFSFMLIGLLYVFRLFYINQAYPDELPLIMSGWFAFPSRLHFLLSFIKGCILCCFTIDPGFVNPPLWCYWIFFFQPLIAFLVIQYFDSKETILKCSYVLSILFFITNSNWLCLPLSLILYLLPKTKRTRNAGIWIFTAFFIVETALQNTSGFLALSFETTRRIMMAFGLMLFCLSVNMNKTIFNKPFFSKLNEISFGIYLLHMPLICSAGYYLWTVTPIPVPVIFLIILLLLVVLSILFHFFIEKKLCGFIIKFVDKKIKH